MGMHLGDSLSRLLRRRTSEHQSTKSPCARKSNQTRDSGVPAFVAIQLLLLGGPLGHLGILGSVSGLQNLPLILCIHLWDTDPFLQAVVLKIQRSRPSRPGLVTPEFRIAEGHVNFQRVITDACIALHKMELLTHEVIYVFGDKIHAIVADRIDH